MLWKSNDLLRKPKIQQNIKIIKKNIDERNRKFISKISQQKNKKILTNFKTTCIFCLVKTKYYLANVLKRCACITTDPNVLKNYQP